MAREVVCSALVWLMCSNATLAGSAPEIGPAPIRLHAIDTYTLRIPEQSIRTLDTTSGSSVPVALYTSVGDAQAPLTLFVAHGPRRSTAATQEFYRDVYPVLEARYVGAGLLRIVAIEDLVPTEVGVALACAASSNVAWSANIALHTGLPTLAAQEAIALTEFDNPRLGPNRAAIKVCYAQGIEALRGGASVTLERPALNPITAKGFPGISGFPKFLLGRPQGDAYSVRPVLRTPRPSLAIPSLLTEIDLALASRSEP